MRTVVLQYKTTMNVKEYISSGAVESYVLGLATELERQEFESLCAQYPEITAARDGFERALENQLLQDAVPPPVHVKENILEKIKTVSAEQETASLKRVETPVRSIGIWKWVAAASLILLAVTAWWAFDTNNKYKELQANNNRLENQLAQSTSQLDTMREDAGVLQKAGIRMATMKGTSNPTVSATVFWDTTSANKDVYLMINNLPQPASDKQYQLWALLEGKPIDLGVFARQQRLLVKMKNVQNAQAFAITLEPMGGSPAPTSQPIAMTSL